MPREKVLWLIKGLGMGGAERLLEMAIPYFDRNKFDYEVAYCLAGKKDLVPALQQAGIPTFCLNLKSGYDPRGPYILWRLLRERRPQILHLHLPYTGILGRVVGHIAGVKSIVYTEHNVIEMYHPVTRLLNLLTYPMNRVTIAVSDEVYRSVSEHRIVNQTKLLVIRNGIDLNFTRKEGVAPDKTREALGIPVAHQVVGNVAHVRPEKGQIYLLQAAKFVLDRRLGVTFVIVGREKTSGEIRRLEELAIELGIRDHIIFTGFREDVLDLMRVFDLFVLSSLHEGLPIALLEAMSLGKPAIATSVGGIPEVIEDGVNGFLVPPKDPKALSEKILLLLQDDALRAAMSRSAAGLIQERFSIEAMVKKVEQVYSSMLSNHH